MSEFRHLIPLIERLDTAVVGCAGDIILDHFVYGEVSRISPEAPIPVIRIGSQRSMLGGVGNVVRNLGALGCSIRLFSVTGEDSAGLEITSMLKEVPRCQAHIVVEKSRQTSVKTRYVAHNQQLLRTDRETTQAVSPEILEQVLCQFEAAVADCSIVFLSDYAKGMLNGAHASDLIRIARSAGKYVIVDPKGSDFTRYRHATIIKPNLKELGEATGMPVGDTAAQEAAARRLLENTGAEIILLTRGSRGMLLTIRDQPSVEFPALAREVYDVSGAGDTVAAALAAALGSGAGIADAVNLANIAAGIVVGKAGTAVADRTEIVREIELHSSIRAGDKVLPRAEAVERVTMWRRMGFKVGLAYGCFDLLSIEHIALFEDLRSRCDRLIVALQSDRSAALGGGSPPVRNQQARAVMLGALAFVDGIVVFDEESPAAVIEELQPDSLGSGAGESSSPEAAVSTTADRAAVRTS